MGESESKIQVDNLQDQESINGTSGDKHHSTSKDKDEKNTSDLEKFSECIYSTDSDSNEKQNESFEPSDSKGKRKSVFESYSQEDCESPTKRVDRSPDRNLFQCDIEEVPLFLDNEPILKRVDVDEGRNIPMVLLLKEKYAEFWDFYDDKYLNHEDNNGDTLLFYAIRSKNVSIIDCLLDYNLDPCHKNKQGKRPQDLLIEYGFFTLSYKLEKHLRYHTYNMTPEMMFKEKFPQEPTVKIIPRIRKAIMDDNVGKLLMYFPTMSNISYILLVAAFYRSEKICDMCIEQNIGLEFKDENRSTPFTYLSYRGMDHQLHKYLDKMEGKKNFLLMKASNGLSPVFVMRSRDGTIVDKLWNISCEPSPNLDFRVYTMDEFETVHYLKRKSSTNSMRGVYGDVIHVIHKTTGIQMAIKKYREVDNWIDDSAAREITLIRMINRITEGICAKIYGIVLHNDKINLVQEYLPENLSMVFPIINGTSPERKPAIVKELYLELFQLVDRLNGLGIGHNDCKPENIMMDYTGKIKLVDFGLSHFYGIMPPLICLSNSMVTEHYKPPDADKEHHLYDGRFHKTKTYKIDSYGIGVCILNNEFRTSYNYYMYYQDRFIIIYKSNRSHNTVPSNRTGKLLPGLKDLLSKVLEWNQEKRYYAFDAVSHPYFIGNEEESTFDVIPRSITPLTGISRYTTYSTYSKEMYYMESIVHHWKHFKLVETNTCPIIDLEYLSDMIKYTGQSSIPNIDLLMNCIPKVRNFVAHHSTDFSTSDIACSYMYLTSLQVLPYFDDFEKHCKLHRGTYRKDSVKSLTKIIVSDPLFYEFVPVATIISYICVRHQINNDTESNISMIGNFLFNGLLKWILYNVQLQPTIWELVLKIYREIPNIVCIDFGQSKTSDQNVKRILELDLPEKFGEIPQFIS